MFGTLRDKWVLLSLSTLRVYHCNTRLTVASDLFCNEDIDGINVWNNWGYSVPDIWGNLICSQSISEGVQLGIVFEKVCSWVLNYRNLDKNYIVNTYISTNWININILLYLLYHIHNHSSIYLFLFQSK